MDIHAGFLALPALRWITRHRRSGFSAAAANLANSTAALIRETEPDFLRLADDLKALYAGAAELGQSTAAQASSMRTTLGACNLTGPNGVAGVLLDKLQSGLAETGRELNSLAEVCSAIRCLLHLGRQIMPIAVFLRTAGYSFRVESARVEAARQTFGTFSEELSTLAGRIGGLGEEIEGRAEAAHTELAQLVQAITADLNQLQEIARRAGPIVRDTCEETQLLLDSSLSALEQSEAQAVAIARHANDAIYHMQFGDIVRQKLEHIGTALTESAAALATGNKSAGGADRILAVQGAQIAMVIDEIRSVQKGVAQAFAGLRTEGAHLAETLGDLQSGTAGASSRTGPFEDLKKHLLYLEEVTSRGAGLRDRSRRSWLRAMEASGEVCRCMDQVREINFSMHLQSLNAIVKTEWLGEEGRTLRVLSMHMHTMFRESSALVADTTAVLATIARPDDTGSGAEVDAAALKFRLAGDLDEVYRAQEQLQRTIDAAAALSRRQADRLEQAQGSLRFLALATARLEALSQGIGELRKDMLPLRTTSPGADAYDPGALDGLYTMASERHVYQRLMDDEAPEPGEVVPVGAGLEPVGAGSPDDNIEFF
jgi:hypothetical protein